MMIKPKEWRIIDPYQVPGKYFRAQLHCHTIFSDGRLSPAEATKFYCQRGFSILCITDHARRTDIEGLSSERIMVVCGREITVCRLPWSLGKHLVLLGDATGRQKELLGEVTGDPFAGIAMAAHPSWKGNLGSGQWTERNLIGLPGLCLVETRNPHSSSEEDMARWRQALVARGPGKPLWGTAVDDLHELHQAGTGWVEVKMAGLNREEFFAALHRGSFYMSNGPQAEFSVEAGAIITHSPGTVINCSDADGRTRAEEKDRLKYHPSGEEGFLIVHCRDEQGGWACSQPFWIIESEVGENDGSTR
ncbi:MAG: hypothetical protein PHX89_03855 [bacterium]|jgi:hypothetical protein|nr:hypothetical protein [bacterium]MDD4558068.1 hypothetical protein [bacterium]